MISLLIKHYKNQKQLKFSKGKSTLTIPLGFQVKPDSSKQSSFKEWNEQNIKRKQM